MNQISAEFQHILVGLFRREGGYSNRKNDRGGETNLGITDRLDGKIDGKIDVDGDGVGDVAVKDLTQEQAAQIYARDFWNPIRGGQLPPPLDMLTFDVAVNSGVKTAIKNLQKALGVLDDGDFGNDTLTAVKTCNLVMTVKKFLSIRANHYRDIVIKDPSQKVFLTGWLNRVAILQTQAEKELPNV